MALSLKVMFDFKNKLQSYQMGSSIILFVLLFDFFFFAPATRVVLKTCI